jgi:hypothetical protein
LFFPHFHFNEVKLRQVKQVLLRCFQRWGLPRAIKVDNGKPFGDPQRNSVPELALWLIALGIKVIWNAPRSPRCNAKVERMQATTAAWAEVDSCVDCRSLQHRLDRVAFMQREKYELRALRGKNRRQLYAALWTNPRRYGKDSFKIKRVYGYLSKVIFKRRVNKNGRFTFYAQKVYVGSRHKTEVVDISFDRRQRHFKVSGKSGAVFAHFRADNFSEHAIRSLRVCTSRFLSALT